MALVMAQTPLPFDLLVFDPNGTPVLAAEVKAQPVADPAKRERWLRDAATNANIQYGLFVDRRSIRLFDLTIAGADGQLLELPTQTLLECYAHDLDAQRASERYLVQLTDTWLRNVMQPLASQPPPGIERLRELGVAERLRDGRTEFEWRGYF
ncbi:MAG: hypothetical protein AB1Z98_39830 [Nannocystaceae bacterium]